VSASDFTGTEPPLTGATTALPQRVLTADGPNWLEQDGLLREMWMQNQPPAAIAQALDRSVPAIMTRAARLGLPRRSAPGRKPGRRPIETTSTVRVTTVRSTVSAPLDSEAVDKAAQTAARVCLMCLSKFQSLGRHNRICPSCKSSAEYESGSRLPDFDLPVADV